MADEIVTRYKLDAEGWIKGAEQIDKGTDQLIQDNKKLETSFGEVSKSTTKAFSADSVKQFNKEAGKALKDTKKETDNLTGSTKNVGNAFTQLKKDLKSVQGDLATLSLRGREGSKLFKALSSDAGQLKDQMADLGDAINQQGASPLENFTGSLGSAKSALFNLDIEGATRSFGIAGAQISKITFKDLSASAGQAVQGIVKLGASILSSPLFITAGVVAGIVAAVVLWGDSIDSIRAKNDKLFEKLDRNSTIILAQYEAQRIAAEALGQSTDDIEQKTLARQLRDIKTKVDAKKKESQFLINNLSITQKAQVLIDKTTNEEFVRNSTETGKELIALQAEEITTRAQLRAIGQKAETKKKEEEDKKEEERQKAANEKFKQSLEERRKILEAFNKEAQRIRSEEALQTKNDLEAANKKIADISNQNIVRTKKDNSELTKIRLKNVEDETLSFSQRNRDLQQLYEEGLIDFTEFSERKKKLIEDEVTFSIAQRKRELDAAIQLGNDLVSIGESFLQIARNMGMKTAEAEKAFAVFGIAVNLAQSLGNVILGATTAAAAAGPLAPFALAGYIASGTAAVLAAFAQATSIIAQEPPSFAHGGWTGDGGKFEPAGVVHKDEWVTTKENTNKYWDELNAIHDGTFDDLLMYKYIAPALAHAIKEEKTSSNKSFADNLANSIRLNFKNKDVVGAILAGNSGSNKNTQKIVKAITQTRRPSYRKK